MAFARKDDARAYQNSWRKGRRRSDAAYRAKSYAAVAAADTKRRNTPTGRLQHLLYTAKKRAAKRGWAFSLTLADLGSPPVTCPVLGLRINYGPGKSMDPDRASIDRLVGCRGYVPGNVRVISYRANSLKTNATLAELRAVVRYMEGRCA